MNEAFDYTIEFINTNFDLSSELPEKYNGGNPCYGQDVAKYLANELLQKGYSSEIIDEDWGWFITGNYDENSIFEICIYPWGYLDDAKGEDFHLWRLRVSYKKKVKILKIFPTNKIAICPKNFIEFLKKILNSDGNKFKRVELGLRWR